MQEFPAEYIDLIATDPPFNSKRDYFVPFRDEHGQEPDALVKAFTDTWTWGNAAEEANRKLIVDVGGQVADTIKGLRQFLNDTPMMAYLVMMAIRIVEMHRILKSTGSLYLHCDPTASHYLKIILDAIFGTQNATRATDSERLPFDVWNIQALELASTDPDSFEQWTVTHVLKFKANAKSGILCDAMLRARQSRACRRG